MLKKTYIRLWAGIPTIVLLISLLIVVWWTPLEIDHDQHMVDTVNQRAWNYTSDNGTITDFTDAEIMSNDAQLEYEERVWKLEHPELYWIMNISMTLIIPVILWIIGAFIYYAEKDSCYSMFDDVREQYEEDDEPFEEEPEPFEEEE